MGRRKMEPLEATPPAEETSPAEAPELTDDAPDAPAVLESADEVPETAVDPEPAETETETTITPDPAVIAEKSTAEGGEAEAVLAAPYAYYDDDGVLNSWCPGQKVTDPTIIAVLIARGAPLKGQ